MKEASEAPAAGSARAEASIVRAAVAFDAAWEGHTLTDGDVYDAAMRVVSAVRRLRSAQRRAKKASGASARSAPKFVSERGGASLKGK